MHGPGDYPAAEGYYEQALTLPLYPQLEESDVDRVLDELGAALIPPIMRNVVIVQARMASTRLPGKVLKPVLGKPLLTYQVERLRRVEHADAVVLATTTNDVDQVLVDFAQAHELAWYRGSEDDVLSRYHGAAEEAGADVVIRVTSDCPLIDPAVIDRSHCSLYAIPTRLRLRLQYHVRRTYPRGMDCEVFSRKALDTLTPRLLSQPIASM